VRAAALAVVVLAVVLAVPLAAAASDLDVAKIHFQSGASYYEEGRYEDALREFTEAQRLSKLPKMHYNIAECLDRLGRYRDAASELREYLKGVPDAEDRASVEKRIATFDERVKREEETAKKAPTVDKEIQPVNKEIQPVNKEVPPVNKEVPPVEKPAVSTVRETHTPDRERGAVVSFVARNEEVRYPITVGLAGDEQACVTPCSLRVRPGAAHLTVGAAGGIYFERELQIPARPSLVTISHRCTGCYVTGAVLFVLGVVGGGVALGVGDFHSTDDLVKIPSIGVPIAGGVLALVGILVFANGGANRAVLTPSGAGAF